MDLDIIDAQGSAVIFADGGKSATLTTAGGGISHIHAFIDAETVAPFDEPADTSEQRWNISTRQNSRLAKGAKITAGGDVYTLIRQISAGTVETWSARKHG